MNNNLNMLPKQPNLISNALKCVGGSAPDPAGELTMLPQTP